MKKVEEKLKLALDLQKRLKRKIFYLDDELWLNEDALLYGNEATSNRVASLIAEIQSSAEEFQESAFYLVAKQLSDCRRILECKVEQKLGPQDDWSNTQKIMEPQEIWPQAPYVMRKRVVERAFEELYPVEHLSSLFRFGIDLVADCDSDLFGSESAANLVYKTISYQLNATRTKLKNMGYSFVESLSDKGNSYIPERTIMLCEGDMCGGPQPEPIASWLEDAE